MRAILIVCLVLSLIGTCVACCSANIYVVIYATIDGKTGHAGIAIDNYDIIVFNEVEDTVSNGSLTYFDLWPSKDDFGLFSYSEDQDGLYYRLPNGIWSAPLTVASIYDKGIPHRERYPADAILMIKTSPAQDFSLSRYLDNAMGNKRKFNPRNYNCTDFVNDALALIMGRKLKVKEFIPFSYVSTPNKLCRELMQHAGVITVKSPEKKIDGSFFRERVLERNKRRGPFDVASVHR